MEKCPHKIEAGQNNAKRAFAHKSVSMWMAPKQSGKDVLAYLDFFCNKCIRQQNIATQSLKS